MNERVMPQSIEVEMQLLGGIMLDSDSREYYEMAATIVEPSDFYLDGHQAIFEAMGRIHGRGQQPGLHAVLDELHSTNRIDVAGGKGVVMGMINAVASGAGTETYAERVLHKSQLRQVIRACLETQQKAYEQEETPDALIFGAQAAFERIAGRAAGSGEIVTAEEFIAREGEKLRERFKRGALLGVTTGFERLDRLTGGFQSGDLFVWTAPVNTGKTKTLCYSLVQAALSGAQVGLISIDMNTHKLFKYLLPPILTLTGSDQRPSDIFQPQTWDGDEPVLRDELFQIDLGGRLLVNPKPRSTNTAAIESCVRKMVKAGCSVVAIDQAQNFADYDPNEHGVIAGIVGKLKRWAWYYGPCIIGVHQVRREDYKNPTIASGQGSSAWEQYADTMIAFVDKGDEGQNPRPMLLKVLKSRDDLKANLKFDFDFARGVTV